MSIILGGGGGLFKKLSLDNSVQSVTDEILVLRQVFLYL